jgi:hypothetical protein
VIFIYGCLALVSAAVILFSILVIKVGQARRASKTPNCFYCGNQALRFSSPHGVADWLLTYWNCTPHRCDICFRRQYRMAARPSQDE